jgi:ABC-type Fe3+-hydroxamate transport system substrate-binding protein
MKFITLIAATIALPTQQHEEYALQQYDQAPQYDQHYYEQEVQPEFYDQDVDQEYEDVAEEYERVPQSEQFNRRFRQRFSNFKNKLKNFGNRAKNFMNNHPIGKQIKSIGGNIWNKGVEMVRGKLGMYQEEPVESLYDQDYDQDQDYYQDYDQDYDQE